MIDSYPALCDLVDHASAADAIALDTEFVWERTYYPKLGVVQIGLSRDECYLIDVPAIEDLSPLRRVLSTPDVVKVLHDARQDLTILYQITGAVPSNVFDTQLAAGFAGLPVTLSLADLIRSLLDVDLPKTESRTDWLQRPLTPRQQAYALDDVRYLLQARRALLQRIRERGREAWLHEELRQYDEESLYVERDPREQFLRLSGTGKLSSRQLAVLRELAAWREREARRRDRPRGHILADNVLVELARRLPRTREALLDRIEAGLAAPEDSLPERPAHRPPDDALTARLHLTIACVLGKSLNEELDMALIATRAELSALTEAGPTARPEYHRLLRGWRRTFVGEHLLQLMAGEGAVYIDPQSGVPLLIPSD